MYKRQTLFYQSRQGPDSNIVVDGYTVTNAGRVGITPADVTSGSFDNIDVVSAATSGIDLEADVKGLGDGTLTFDHVVTAKGIHIVEPITSATFTDTTMTGDFLLTHPGAVSYQGSITCNRRSPVACVTVKAGTLALDATFAYLPGTNTPTTPFMRAIPPGVITTPTACLLYTSQSSNESPGGNARPESVEQGTDLSEYVWVQGSRLA